MRGRVINKLRAEPLSDPRRAGRARWPSTIAWRGPFRPAASAAADCNETEMWWRRRKHFRKRQSFAPSPAQAIAAFQ